MMADVISQPQHSRTFACPGESGISVFPTPVIHQTSEKRVYKRKQKQRCTHALPLSLTHTYSHAPTHTNKWREQNRWFCRYNDLKEFLETCLTQVEQVCNSLIKQDDEMELDVGLVFHSFHADAAILHRHTHVCHIQHRAWCVLFFLRVIGLLHSELLSSTHRYEM